MEDYKKNSLDLGYSDIANLTVMYFGGDICYEPIHMGGDGSYRGYIVEGGTAEIPSHYRMVCEINKASWFCIYDDERNVFDRHFGGVPRVVRFYRGGDYTLLIEIV